MIKKLFIGSLALVIVIAITVSMYNVFVTPATQVQAAELEVEPAISANTTTEQTQPSVSEDTNPEEIIVQPKPTVVVPEVAADTFPAPQYSGQAGGNGNRYGQGQQARGNAGSPSGASGTGANTPQPQNGFTAWVTYQGTVQNLAAPMFTLVLNNGEQISAELGNQMYLDQIGLSIQNGDAITVTGSWDANGALSISQITLDASGQIFGLRDELGRPLWRGGAGH